MALVNDTFDNLDQWTDNGSGGTSAIDAGRLKQATSGTSQTPSMLSDDPLSGEFDISVEWEASTSPTPPSGWGLFFALRNSSGTAQTYIARRTGGAGGILRTYDTKDVGYTGLTGEFRIARTISGSESTYYLYYHDGTAWRTMHAHTQPNTDDVYVRLYLQSDNWASALSGYWDNLDVAVSEDVNLTNDTFDDLGQWYEYSGTNSVSTGALVQSCAVAYETAEVRSLNWLAPGDFTLELDYSLDTIPSSGSWSATFVAGMPDGTTYGAIYLNNDYGVTCSTFDFISRTSDSGTMRITRAIDGTNADWTFEVDQGSGWESIGTATNTYVGPCRVAVQTANGSASTALQATYDNFLTGQGGGETVSADLYCPDSEVEFLGPAAVAGQGFGFPDCADLPYFLANTVRNDLASWDSADVPMFFATSNPIALLRVPDSAVVPSFRATTGRVVTISAPDCSDVPRFHARVGGAATFRAPDCADVPRCYALVNGFATILLPDSEVIPVFSVWGERYVVVMNTLHHGVTEYSNFPFESLTEFEGRYYGLTGAGWYLLGGAADSGAEIATSVTTGDMTYNNGEEMRLLDAKLTARSAEQVKLTVAYNDETGYDYFEDGDPAGEIKSVRFVPGKGAKGRTLRLTIENTNGGSMEAKQLVMTVADLSRGGR